MKLIRMIALGLFSLIFILQGDDLLARAKSYPLMCHGGGDMQGSFSVNSVKFKFVGAKQGAGVRLPQAGECAWLD